MGRGHTHAPGLCLPELMVPEINPVHNQKDCSNRPHTQVLRSTHTLPWYLGCTSDHSFKKAPVSEWLSEWVPVCHIPSLDTSESYIHKANYVTQQKLRIHSCEFFAAVVQSLSAVFANPRTAGCQSSLSFSISRSLLKLMFTESMMPSNHLILRRPITFLFTWNERALCETRHLTLLTSTVTQEGGGKQYHWGGDAFFHHWLLLWLNLFYNVKSYYRKYPGDT